MKTLSAAFAASLLLFLTTLANSAQAQNWTGFSVGVGGGVGFLDSNINANGSRSDQVGCATGLGGCTAGLVVREIDQNFSSSFSELGDAAGFFTLQGAYDYQFANRWVAGGFVDADWSGMSGHAKQSENSLITFVCATPPNCEGEPDGSFSPSNGLIDAEVSTNWSVSVGGRLGWLANPNTLLYFLASYTHADLGDARVKVNIPDPSDLIGVLLGGSPGTNPCSDSSTICL